jgi:hypothetical protein
MKTFIRIKNFSRKEWLFEPYVCTFLFHDLVTAYDCHGCHDITEGDDYELYGSDLSVNMVVDSSNRGKYT